MWLTRVLLALGLRRVVKAPDRVLLASADRVIERLGAPEVTVHITRTESLRASAVRAGARLTR